MRAVVAELRRCAASAHGGDRRARRGGQSLQALLPSAAG